MDALEVGHQSDRLLTARVAAAATSIHEIRRIGENRR